MARKSGGSGHNRLVNAILAGGDARAARIAARAIKTHVLRPLKGKVPVDTGELKKSLKIQARGNRVQLRGTSYARLVKWLPPGRDKRTSVAREAITTLHRNKADILDDIASDHRAANKKEYA